MLVADERVSWLVDAVPVPGFLATAQIAVYGEG